MAIRPHPTKGAGWWQIIISQGRGKKQKVYVWQGTQAEAHAYEAHLKGVPAAAQDATVADLLGRFFDWYAVHRAAKTNEECHRAFKLLLPLIGKKHLSLLQQIDYDRYKAKRLRDGVAKRTINIELNYLASFLNWAKDQGHQPGAMPRRFSKKEEAPKTKTVLSRTEIARLIAAMPEDKRPIVQLMAWCGLRREEALTLQSRHVDFDHRVLIVTGKGSKTRVMPIVGQDLHDALKDRCKDLKQKDYIFINPKTQKPYNSIKRALLGAAQRAGLKKRVHHHLLRHSFGTAAITAGVGQRALQGMLGHSDIRTTEIYTHLAAELLQAEAFKLGTWLGASEMSETEKEENPK